MATLSRVGKRSASDVTLLSAGDDDSVRVTLSAAAASRSHLVERCLRHMRERATRTIFLPTVDPDVLTTLAAFLAMDAAENPSPKKQQRGEFQFPVPDVQCLQLLVAAYYTETWPLFGLCARMVLHHADAVESLDGVPEPAVLRLIALASPAQLARLEDAFLLRPDVAAAAWARRPLSLPNVLRGCWEDAELLPEPGSRGVFESLRLWAGDADGVGALATRVHLSADAACSSWARFGHLTAVRLVACSGLPDATVWQALEGLPSLRQLIVRLTDENHRGSTKLRVPAAVAVRLTHLEVSGSVRLGKRTPTLLRLRHFASHGAVSAPLRFDWAPDGLEALALVDTGLVGGRELGLLGGGASLASVASLSLAGSRIAGRRLGGGVMPDGAELRTALEPGRFAALSRLDLSRCNLHDDDELRECLQRLGPQLIALDASDNKLMAAACSVIFKYGRRLERLILTNNRIGDGLASAVLMHPPLPRLAVLSVAQNFVPPSRCQALLCFATQHLPALQSVDASRQSQWTREYVALRRYWSARDARVVLDPIDLETEAEALVRDVEDEQEFWN